MKKSSLFKIILIFLIQIILLNACGGDGNGDDTVGDNGGNNEGGNEETTFTTSGFGFSFCETAEPDIELWRFETRDFEDMTSPAISSDGTVYIGSADKYLYAIQSDGNLMWEFRSETADEIINSPSIDSNGTIYFVDAGRTLYALNPDGNKKWSVADIGETEIAIAKDGSILIGEYALNPDDGSINWDAGYLVTQSPIIDSDGNGTVFLSSGTILMAHDVSDDSEIWEFVADSNIRRAAIGSNKTLYFGDANGIFYAVDKNGEEKWRYIIDANSTALTTPVIGLNGVIYVANNGCAV